MRPEQKLTQDVVKMFRRLRDEEGLPLWWLKMAGGAMQRRGVPDFNVIAAGRAVFPELKSTTGRVSPLQQVEMSRITQAGGVSGAYRQPDALEHAIRWVIDREMRRQRLIDAAQRLIDAKESLDRAQWAQKEFPSAPTAEPEAAFRAALDALVAVGDIR